MTPCDFSSLPSAVMRVTGSVLRTSQRRAAAALIVLG